ncbi:hypothetical protein AVEN_203526-1 [Araneus ventricosus]|uniref:Uncharacterized protein n=1 Tax=Araneus ventricosus TaxID=182803 RepID=A0A4Y2LR16_ARAVE|nr:hypothetical protein AVEN_203526-1 [Araneus ventricosus]
MTRYFYPRRFRKLRVGVGMCLMVAVILIVTTNGVLSAPAGAEPGATDLPTDEDTKIMDKFKSVTVNIKRYFGVFMSKMETDLWMSVGIVFASVFLLCCAVYFVVTSVSCVAKCLRC